MPLIGDWSVIVGGVERTFSRIMQEQPQMEGQSSERRSTASGKGEYGFRKLRKRSQNAQNEPMFNQIFIEKSQYTPK